MPQVSAASAQCLSTFGQLCSELDTASVDNAQLMPLSDIQSQRGRFRVWCGNLGALQQGPSSVEYRLRDSPVIHSNVVKLLQQLRSHLTESIAVVSGSRPAFEDQPKPEDSSPSETEDESNSGLAGSQPRRELEMRLSRIKAILRDLYKLGFKIRNPHIRPVSLRASLHRQVDSETNVDVFDSFAIFDYAHVDELLTQLRTGRPAPDGFVDYLKPRLAAAITRRRRQFKYWERHARKLESQVYDTDDEREVNPTQDIPEKAGEDNDTGLRKREHGLNAAKSHAGYTLLSQTEASRYYEKLDNSVEVGTVVTTASTAIDINGNYVDLPDPPALASDEDFTCPYCFVLCEQKYGKKKPWRAHLLHDLQPYVCTYDECSNGDQLFASRKSWAEHEASVHRQSWRCFEHSLYYKSAAGLRGHFIKEHASSLTNVQMDGLTDLATTGMADNRDMCPICFEAAPFTKGLENHIANHLERFSIFALPKSYGDAEQSLHGSGSQRNGSRSTLSFNRETLEFSDNGVANDATSLDESQKLDLGSDEQGAHKEEHDLWVRTEHDIDNERHQGAERQPYRDQTTGQDAKIPNEDEAEIEAKITVEEEDTKVKGKSNADLAASTSISSPILAECLREAERSQNVSLRLEGLRNALPKTYHTLMSGLILEIYTTERQLRNLAEKAQHHISLLHFITPYSYALLPCLAKTLLDMIEYYEDRSMSKEKRWLKMYHDMSNELPGITLPARFILFNEFLSMLMLLLTRSPNLDFNALTACYSQVLQLSEAQNLPDDPRLRSDALRPGESRPVVAASSELDMHWAKMIFARPPPTRTLLPRGDGNNSRDFGPFLNANHVINPPDSTVLFKRSFDRGSINLTVFLNIEQLPFLLLRSTHQGQPWLSLKGAHELCIARASPNMIIFTRWSRSETRDKVWARLLFITWEELVLLYNTFNSLKARSLATVACQPEEFVIHNDLKLFQARIADDGYHHMLSVRQESLTGCMRLIATVSNGVLKDSPVWTAFIPAVNTKPEAHWVSRKSRLQVCIRDIEPYVFCHTYDASRQRDPRTGNFVLHFINESGATHFLELFPSGDNDVTDETASPPKPAGPGK